MNEANAMKPTVPLVRENPLFVRILGICSAIAVTGFVQPTLVMATAIVVTASLSCLVVSLMRNLIPHRTRLMVQVGIIAAIVTIANLVIKAFWYDMNTLIGPYLALITTNCIVLGRCETRALNDKPLVSLADGFMNALGYALALLVIAIPREIIGSGSLCGLRILPDAYQKNFLIAAPAGAFFLAGVVVWIARAVRGGDRV